MVIVEMGRSNMSKLVAYFSRADENYFSGALKVILVGNTEIAAKMIQDLTGADIFKMEPVQPYSKDYNECIEEARNDQKRDARPELEAYPESIDKYDTIYLGYPNYWGTMPMPVFTFLEHFDFTGKTIYPFCTHEGSGMGRSKQDIIRICPGAKVRNGLAIHGSNVSKAEPQIRKFIEG